MNKNKNIILLICLHILLISCNRNQSESKIIIDNIKFDLDYGLLSSDPIYDGSTFSMYLPKTWISIDSISMLQLSREIESKDNLISLELFNAFQSTNSSICVISKVISLEDNFEYIPKDYILLLQDQFSTQNIKSSHVKINDSILKQIIISNKDVTLIRLFINGSLNYQVDYFIPRLYFKREINLVQSSIASIISKGE